LRFIKVLACVAVLAGVFTSAAFAGGYTDASYATPVGKVGVPYSHTIAWKPGTGCPPYGYHLDPGNEMPPGLSLNSSSGVISGTPTKDGTYTFYVSQVDQCGVEGQGNSPFRITIEGGAPPVPPLVVTSSSAPAAEVSLSYSMTLGSSGGKENGKTWSVSGGSLPPGLTLASTGQISGTPSTAGSYSFSVSVSDGSTTASRTLSINVIPGISVNSSAALPAAEVRTSYTAALPTLLGTTGGVAPYRYTAVSGFPFGIGFDTSTGTVFGSPRAAGTLTLTIAITDANGATKQVPLSLVVVPKVHIVPIDLHRARVGKSYRAKITVTGGQTPAWSISAGKLPSGLALNSRTGLIKGTPRRGGSFPVTVTVKDSLGGVVSTRYTLVVTR
jgi:large repetitive protein